jgi:hypothetical protein
MLVLTVMGEAAATTEASLQELHTTTEASIQELRASLDLLHGNVARINTTQQQLMEQMGLISAAVENSTKANDAVARQLAALEHRLVNNTQPMDCDRGCPPSLEEADADPEAGVVTGKATLRPAHVKWTGNTPGASSAAGPGGEGDGHYNNGSDGILGGARPGGAGGGSSRGACGGRPVLDGTLKHQLKMSFPKFSGDHPKVWKDKCLDYFRLFNVNPSLWLVSCTLHMEANAALWLKAYRLCHEVNS